MNDQDKIAELTAEIASLNETIKWYQGQAGQRIGEAARAALPVEIVTRDLMPKRFAFIAWCEQRGLETVEDQDAWGKRKFKHSHIEALWEGWFNAPDDVPADRNAVLEEAAKRCDFNAAGAKGEGDDLENTNRTLHYHYQEQAERDAAAIRALKSAAPASVPQLAVPNRWQPIETAPKDGTYIILGSAADGGAWVGKYQDTFQSGWRPDNPWRSMMLNTDYLQGKRIRLRPTHWSPLPSAPGTAQAINDAPAAPLPELTGPSIGDDPEFNRMIGEMIMEENSLTIEGILFNLAAYIDSRPAASPSLAPAQQQEPYTVRVMNALRALHVGSSSFEGWFAQKEMSRLGIKQLCRDAYAAGMEDPSIASVLVAAQCRTCNGHGLIGAMTAEGGEGWPCPDCSAETAAPGASIGDMQ